MNRFIYPTKKNVLLGFIVSQLFPIILLSYVGKLSSVLGWVLIELVIVAGLCMWRLKPDSELDERELKITFKWKSRMLDYGSAVVLLPIVILCFKPETQGWNLFIMTGFPVYALFTLFSLLAKKEIGYFFHPEVEKL